MNFTKSDLAKLMDEMHLEEHGTRDSAQDEYARDTSNALANFDRIGAQVCCEHCGKPIGPFVTLLVYALKHWDGILSAIAGNMSQREPVEGRIKDLRVYLVLLRAMFARRGADRVSANSTR